MANRTRNPWLVFGGKVLFRLAFGGLILLQLVLYGLFLWALSSVLPEENVAIGIGLVLILSCPFIVGATSYFSSEE